MLEKIRRDKTVAAHTAQGTPMRSLPKNRCSPLSWCNSCDLEYVPSLYSPCPSLFSIVRAKCGPLNLSSLFLEKHTSTSLPHSGGLYGNWTLAPVCHLFYFFYRSQKISRYKGHIFETCNLFEIHIDFCSHKSCYHTLVISPPYCLPAPHCCTLRGVFLLRVGPFTTADKSRFRLAFSPKAFDVNIMHQDSFHEK